MPLKILLIKADARRHCRAHIMPKPRIKVKKNVRRREGTKKAPRFGEGLEKRYP
jgi:hypothetical protein